MKRRFVTKDTQGKKYVYDLPEYVVYPWERGGAFDLAMLLALAVIGTALFYV